MGQMDMANDEIFLTPEEVVKRYRGAVTTATLRNWRALKIGPAYTKIGKAVLYPLSALEKWDRLNTVECDRTRSPALASE